MSSNENVQVAFCWYEPDQWEMLKRGQEPHDLPGQLAVFGISGGLGGGMKRLFMSHPPLDERIQALQE